MEESIVVEQVLASSLEEAWDALTNHELMTQWFFEDIPDFKEEVGFKTEFLVVSEDRNFTHQWEVKEVVPGVKLVLGWSYVEYEGSADVSFELRQEGMSTLLTITNGSLTSFPDDVPEFERDSCEAGWRYFSNRLAIFIRS
jgi:uncharacterized protein YndB with AHSA1/START domain